MSKIIDLLKLSRFPNGYKIFLRRQFDSGRVFSILIKMARIYRRVILRKPLVCGVIGSLGKTTATRTVRAAAGGPVREPYYSNYGSSLACNVMAIRPWDHHAILEAGIAYPGMMDSNAYMLKPDMAVVTSIAWEHFRSFKSQEEIRNEKVKMVRALPKSGWAVLNGDDENVRWMATQTSAQVIYYGFGEDCDVRLISFEYQWPLGMRGKVSYKDHVWDLSTRMYGRHFWYAILAGLTAALCWGIDPQEAIERLGALEPTHKRFEPIGLDNDIWVVDDTCKGGYDSWITALQAFKDLPVGRKIIVFGDIEDPPGSRAETYQEIAEMVGQVADHLILYGSGKDIRKTRAAATRGGVERDHIIQVKDLGYEGLVKALRGIMRPGDVILVKGRSAYRMERVALALQERTINCPLKICNLKVRTCAECPMLTREQHHFDNHFIHPYIKQ